MTNTGERGTKQEDKEERGVYISAKRQTTKKKNEEKEMCGPPLT
jgi:hypothetical protein